MNSSVLFQSFHSLVKDDNRLNNSYDKSNDKLNEKSNDKSNNLSYSMFVDKKSSSPITTNISTNSTHSTDSISSVEDTLENLISVEPRKIYTWVEDKTVSKCYKCNQLFTLFNRKHHCRNCGKIFCKLCSNYFISIPNKGSSILNKVNIFFS